MTAIERAALPGGSIQIQTPLELSVAEDSQLIVCFQREAESVDRFRALSEIAQQVLLARTNLMDRQGDIWLSQEKTIPLIPAVGGGRPSTTGYISKKTLNKADAELEAAGILSYHWSKGKRTNGFLSNGIPCDRTPSIKVWKLDHEIWMKAWARFNAWREKMVRMLNRALRYQSLSRSS